MSGLSSAPRCIAVFGGAFDPPHIGHVAAAKKVLARIKPDLLLIAPAGAPQLKDAPPRASIARRLAMAQLAFADLPKTEVCDADADPDVKSYTFNLISKLARRCGADSEFYLVLGYDAISALERWFRFRDLLTMVTIVAVGRQPDQTAADFASVAALKAARIVDIGYSGASVSSTELRRARGNSRLFEASLAPQTLRYIRARKLY